ncbi:uncharacterized protein LOC124808407 [Hydra vulgaris]|uniref:uncharacterized protein LOC124808407 n=1 Tax=Hydra vulgaris TaxID=6087 RepID=UPI001F5FA950|nr:uncharacterized protein LOC124808407 [Hydra vulgaris]
MRCMLSYFTEVHLCHYLSGFVKEEIVLIDLSCKSMLHNFPTYIKSQAEQFSSVLTELQQIKYMKKPIYLANIIRYSLILLYTSMQSYQLLREELPLPLLSLLKKITSGNIDALSCAKRLKLEGKISQDICLIFDEMYLQKCEEYFAGEMIGSDESGEMYKGIVCFMIVGLKQNIPYVIKTSPEKTINAEWLKEEIFECLRILTECEFNVRVIVCDNHSANVSCFKKILCALNQQAEDFNFNGFKEPIIVCGGEIKWSTFHNIYEKDLTLNAGLRKAPKITMKVLHPGNFKQNVSLALAIFDETTSAAIHSYFPDVKGSADFLTLFNKWWVLSNSKCQYSACNILGNAVVSGDKKPEFLRETAHWIEVWQSQKIPNCEKFTLSVQTAAALIRTLNSHASLIEDLLNDGYHFVLTARFQSDPLERRFGQYRQMSGGRFLVGLKDVTISEKILKIKSIVKESINFDDSLKVPESENNLTDWKNFLLDIDEAQCTPEIMTLAPESWEVGAHIAGYIAKKLKKRFGTCCKVFYNIVCVNIDESNPDHTYLTIISRGGLTIPSPSLLDYVCTSFAMIDYFYKKIKKFSLHARQALEYLLNHFYDSFQTFSCPMHEKTGIKLAGRIVVNIFLNNKRIISTSEVAVDHAKSFKKRKFEKI